MTGVKIRPSERWKHRRKYKPQAIAPAPALLEQAPVPIATRAERVLIDRWVREQIVDRAPSNCFGCKLPIVVGQKWVELVRDNCRARFHCDCEPVWRAEKEVLARKTLGFEARDK
jgi:hypothetical protein